MATDPFSKENGPGLSGAWPFFVSVEVVHSGFPARIPPERESAGPAESERRRLEPACVTNAPPSDGWIAGAPRSDCLVQARSSISLPPPKPSGRMKRTIRVGFTGAELPEHPRRRLRTERDAVERPSGEPRSNIPTRMKRNLKTWLWPVVAEASDE